ncbi:MAG: 1-deoxy-D-xylulose-5-phosphate synthase [Leptospiraceae bacterium]|nr:1-deoxy-D-xylulose-5-phosphate synthase [Leptospiraceae bacterium]
MSKYPLLEKISSPKDLRELPLEALPVVCNEIREYIIDTLSEIGGHFASNLGAIELTVAIHYVYETPIDKLIWDVGHQTYPHKILTGRREALKTVRKFNGISGFPKREESEYDLYNTGHAGTSISQLLGESVARDVQNKTYKCLAVIGDASISCGMALEALNHGGDLKPNCLIILNDNFMSISKNIGSISNYLNSIISSYIYDKYKRYYYNFLKWFPLIGPFIVSFSKKVERMFKNFLIPGGLFEDLGISYIGPVDGHNVLELVRILRNLKERQGPVLLHVLTQKGKGYLPAEGDPIKYHGVTPFNKDSGSMNSTETKMAFSKIVGECLTRLTEQDKTVVAITPAMIEGSGLKSYSEKFPNNIFDVGIAEQHSVTFASGLLGGNLIPFMCIYSTFLTRAMDQVVHDVSLMNLPVRFVIDRAGIVGPDGETHQGLFDLGYLASLPYMSIYIPSTAQDLVDSIYFMKTYNQGPIAVRFPKSSEDKSKFTLEDSHSIEFGKSRVLEKGSDVCIIFVGSFLDLAKKTSAELNKKNLSATLVDLQWLRPLDLETINREISQTKIFIILDESYFDAGVTGYILPRLAKKCLSKYHKTFALPDEVIPHGERVEVMDKYDLTPVKISESIVEYLGVVQT